MLINGIQPINILQTIEEEVPYCHEQIIDVVTHEINFRMLSQEKTKSFIGPSQCLHAGPEKHVIQCLASSPDHFDHFDLAWAAKPGCDSMRHKGEGGVLKDTIILDPCPESVSSKKGLLFGNNRGTDSDINRSKQIITVEGSGGTSTEYEHATHHFCKFDERKELSFSSDSIEKETQVLSTTASMKRGQILQSPTEGCAILNSNKRLKTDLVSSPQKHLLTISKYPDKRQIQIVPEIETIQESRRRPDVQSTKTPLHTVPPEVDDIMAYNTPFHLDEQTFQKCCITEDKTTQKDKPECFKTVNMFTKDDCNNQKNTDGIAQLPGTVYYLLPNKVGFL